MKTFYPYLLIFLISIGNSIGQNSQTQPTYFDPVEFDAYVQQAMKDWDVPGLSIAVIKDDSVVFLKGYGVREIGKPGVVDENTLFATASTTKAFTAAVIGMLVDEGKLDWDDPVVEHVPWFRLKDPYLTAQITVRDLLTHRSGIDIFASPGVSIEEITNRLHYAEGDFPLRSGFGYSNVMYSIAGQLIENVSGMTWNRFIKTRIFDPLGMRRSTTRLIDALKKDNVVSPHAYVSDVLKPTYSDKEASPIEPAGSIWSSASEISSWIAFLLRDCQTGEGDPLMSKATCDELFKPQTVISDVNEFYPTVELTNPHWMTYGLGWFQHDYEGRKIDFHTGSMAGLVAIAGMIRDENLGMYILANRDHVELRHALMYRVFDLFDKEPARDWSRELKILYDTLAEEEEMELTRQISEMQETRQEDTQPNLPLKDYARIYQDPLYGQVEISAFEDNLRLRWDDWTGTLEHWHYDTFKFVFDRPEDSNFIILWTFDLGADGQPERLRFLDFEFKHVEKR